MFGSRILVERGRLYKSLGMKAEAQEELTKAHILDDEQIDGMDVLATLYSEVGTLCLARHLVL